MADIRSAQAPPAKLNLKLSKVDENRHVAATAGPIVIPTFVINICRYERFRTSKHVRVDGNKKFIAVNSVPTGTSHALRISFWLDLS